MQTVSREVDNNNFVKAIETFQEVANATLTKMIDDLGGSGKHSFDLPVTTYNYSIELTYTIDAN